MVQGGDAGALGGRVGPPPPLWRPDQQLFVALARGGLVSLADPMERYRRGPAGSVDEMTKSVHDDGRDIVRLWRRGGPFVAVTTNALYFEQGDDLLRFARKEVRGFTLTRASNTKRMRWGLLLYLGALPMLIVIPVLALAMALVGAYLVTKGFVGRAILVQVNDERVPPFVLAHNKWRSLRSTLKEWHG